MEIIPKQGYLYVELLQGSDYGVNYDNDTKMHVGRIVSGALNDKGVIIFFEEWTPFLYAGVLVKVEDVLAWIKPEAKDEQADNSESVSA